MPKRGVGAQVAKEKVRQRGDVLGLLGCFLCTFFREGFGAEEMLVA